MRQPEYTADSFERPHDLTPNQFDLSDVIRVEQTVIGVLPTVDPATCVVPTFNRAQNERDLRAGTPVWRQEPHEKIGEIDKVLLDEQTGRAQAFVIRRGFLVKRDVVLPTRFVTELLNDIVHVQITDEEIESLVAYDDSGGSRSQQRGPAGADHRIAAVPPLDSPTVYGHP